MPSTKVKCKNLILKTSPYNSSFVLVYDKDRLRVVTKTSLRFLGYKDQTTSVFIDAIYVTILMFKNHWYEFLARFLGIQRSN